MVNPGTAVYLDAQRIYARNLEVPSGGAVGTARAIAHAYSVFATGGRELGLRPETLDLLAAAGDPAGARLPRRMPEGRRCQFSLGFMKPSRGLAVRQRELVRVTRGGRLARLCRSGGRHRLRAT